MKQTTNRTDLNRKPVAISVEVAWEQCYERALKSYQISMFNREKVISG